MALAQARMAEERVIAIVVVVVVVVVVVLRVPSTPLFLSPSPFPLFSPIFSLVSPLASTYLVPLSRFSCSLTFLFTSPCLASCPSL